MELDEQPSITGRHSKTAAFRRLQVVSVKHEGLSMVPVGKQRAEVAHTDRAGTGLQGEWHDIAAPKRIGCKPSACGVRVDAKPTIVV